MYRPCVDSQNLGTIVSRVVVVDLSHASIILRLQSPAKCVETLPAMRDKHSGFD